MTQLEKALPVHSNLSELPIPSEDMGDPIFVGDTAQIIQDLRNGTPAGVIAQLALRLDMSQNVLFDILRLPRSTLKKRVSQNKPLSATEQDRIYRVNKVLLRALEVLEDEAAARNWMKRSNRALGGEAPLSLLDTEVGYELVLDTLARIELGIVS